MLKVFVLGRPGSGKTTAVNYIHEFAKSQGCPTLRFKDYDILYEMYQEDINKEYHDNRERKFLPAEYEGFDVKDITMFDVALERLRKRVEDLSSDAEGIATIEFARDDYEDALKKFGLDATKGAYFLFVACNLEDCICRIYKRLSNPPKPDYHFVSKRIMQSYYSKGNWDYVTGDCKDDFRLEKVVAINNTSITLEDFKQKVDAFAEDAVNAALCTPVQHLALSNH